MKHLLISCLLMAILCSCKKNSNQEPSTKPTTKCIKNPARVGSTYTIKLPNGASYTQTVTCDTTINGLVYYKTVGNYGPSQFINYIGVDGQGNVWQAANNAGDIAAHQLILIKTGQPIGATWTAEVPSIAHPTTVVHRFTMTHVGGNEKATIASIPYNSGIRVKVLYQSLVNGNVMNTNTYSLVWFCEVGIASTESGGYNTFTVTKFVY